MKIEDLDDTFDVKVSRVDKIKAERVNDLLVNALEGGSNYWYIIKKAIYINDITRKSHEFISDVPFFRGCALIIDDIEGDKEYSNKRLDWDAMQKGLQIMHEKYPRHYDNFINENDDAETGDVFLQCALFGEVIFG